MKGGSAQGLPGSRGAGEGARGGVLCPRPPPLSPCALAGALPNAHALLGVGPRGPHRNLLTGDCAGGGGELDGRESWTQGLCAPTRAPLVLGEVSALGLPSPGSGAPSLTQRAEPQFAHPDMGMEQAKAGTR